MKYTIIDVIQNVDDPILIGKIKTTSLEYKESW